MNRNYWKIVLTVMVLLSALPIHATDFEYEDGTFTYQCYVEQKTAVITFGAYAKGDVTIPEKINVANKSDYNGEYTVTGIGDDAFEKDADITEVSIPSTVTSIGGGAFNGCSRLHSVSFEDGPPL